MDEKDIEDDFEREIRIFLLQVGYKQKHFFASRPTYEFQIIETSILLCYFLHHVVRDRVRSLAAFWPFCMNYRHQLDWEFRHPCGTPHSPRCF